MRELHAVNFYCISSLSRVKKGKALCTWQPFMDVSLALKFSFRMVSSLSFCSQYCDSYTPSSLDGRMFFVFFAGGEIDCVDRYGNTPLHVAAKYGHELLISTLMTNGADTARYGTECVCGI